MIETNALREKVLDLAIRGKLVPQNPNDEPASVLLERIRAEKQQMVKDGKLKAKDIKNDTIIYKGEDNLHYEKFQDGTVKCIENEIPFELPTNWIWCRLSMVGTTNIGLTYKPTEIVEDGTLVLRSCNIRNGKIDLSDTVRVKSSIRDNQYIEKNDILICARNGSKALVGKCAILPELSENVSFGAFMAVYRSICFKYVYYYLNTSFFRKAFDNDDSKQINQVTQAILRDTMIPLPPLAEQMRITEKLEETIELMDFVNDGIEYANILIQQIKSKILDLAIHGKLVPQDPNDEPASVLLERIRAEKEELIKQGKIKPDKKESIIFKGDDNSYYEKFDENIVDITGEIPFNIPENWAWCRLNTLCKKEIKRGKAPKYCDKSNTLVFAQKCNTKKGVINISLAQYLDENILKKYPPDYFMQYNDIVINSTGTGTLGRVGIFEMSDDIYGLPIVPDSHITTIRVSELVIAKYIYALLKLKQPYLETSGEGSTNQKELRAETLSNILVPLPPVSEQKQIVDTINIINQTLNNLELSLN